MLPLYLLIGSVTYLVMLRLLKVVDRADMELVRAFLGKRLRMVSSCLNWILVTPE